VQAPLTYLGESSATSVAPGNASGMIINQQGSGSVALGPCTTLLMSPFRSAAYFDVTLGSYTVNDAFPLNFSVPIFSTLFSGYRIASDLKLIYCPNTSTSSAVAFTLAWTDDPFHPQLGSSAYVDGNYPSPADMLLGPNSLTFAAWMPWSRSFPMSRHCDLSTYYPRQYSTTGTALQRSSFYGALNVGCNSQTTSGFNFYGVLYYDVTYEFFDESPLINSYTLPAFFSGIDHRASPNHPATLTRTEVKAHDPESKSPIEDDEMFDTEAPSRAMPISSAIPTPLPPSSSSSSRLPTSTTALSRLRG